MGQLLVRDMDGIVIEQLKRRAAENHRSLQGELRAILTQAANIPQRIDPALLARIDAIRASTSGKIQEDSADLIREDRDR